MFAKSLISLAVLISSVIADFSITQPVEGTVWKTGSKINITWITDGKEPTTPDKFDLALMSGLETQLQLNSVIASGVDTSLKSYEWTVPSTLVPGTNYAIRAGNGADVKYSHYFSVNSGASSSPSSASLPVSASTSTLASSPSVSKSASSSSAIISTSKSSVISSSSSKIQSSSSTTSSTSKTTAANPTTTNTLKETSSGNGSAPLLVSAFLLALPASMVAYWMH